MPEIKSLRGSLPVRYPETVSSSPVLTVIHALPTPKALSTRSDGARCYYYRSLKAATNSLPSVNMLAPKTPSLISHPQLWPHRSTARTRLAGSLHRSSSGSPWISLGNLVYCLPRRHLDAGPQPHHGVSLFLRDQHSTARIPGTVPRAHVRRPCCLVTLFGAEVTTDMSPAGPLRFNLLS